MEDAELETASAMTVPRTIYGYMYFGAGNRSLGTRVLSWKMRNWNRRRKEWQTRKW